MPYKDREQQNAYARKWYAANREAHIKRVRKVNRRRYVEARQFIRGHLQKNPCVDCGNSDIRVLELDHVRGKKDFNVSDMAKQSSLTVIQKEIAKCEVRCANCHRIRHARVAEW